MNRLGPIERKLIFRMLNHSSEESICIKTLALRMVCDLDILCTIGFNKVGAHPRRPQSSSRVGFGAEPYLLEHLHQWPGAGAMAGSRTAT